MDYSSLAKTALFAGMRTDEIEGLLEQFGISPVTFRRGDILARQGEVCNRLIVLLTGAARGEMGDSSGKVVKVDDIAAPNPLAILFLFGPDNRFPVDAVASDDGQAIVIPRGVVLQMLSRNEHLLENYLNISATFASRLSRKLHFMSFRTIRQKLAVYLLDLAAKSGAQNVRPDRTHLALAEYFGVSRQALEREMKKMAEEGLLSIEGKLITVTDKAALKRIVDL